MLGYVGYVRSWEAVAEWSANGSHELEILDSSPADGRQFTAEWPTITHMLPSALSSKASIIRDLPEAASVSTTGVTQKILFVSLTGGG